MFFQVCFGCVSFNPASMSKTTTSRKVYQELESNSMGSTRRTITGQQLYTEDAHSTQPWLAQLRMQPWGGRWHQGCFLQAEMAPLCPSDPGARSTLLSPANLTDSCQGLGAARSSDWQPEPALSCLQQPCARCQKAQQFLGLRLQEHCHKPLQK